jgi:ABC-type uncharacterized transport system YnjBCD ATPase subunit
MLEQLSGGNQQKVSVARWLRIAPLVMVLDEPTQGVDVGGKQEILDLLRQAAQGGVANPDLLVGPRGARGGVRSGPDRPRGRDREASSAAPT